MPNAIQPRELPARPSQGVVVRTAHRTFPTDSSGYPNVFNVDRNEDGRWLNANDARPENRWNPENAFVFRRRNPLRFSHGMSGGVFCNGS